MVLPRFLSRDVMQSHRMILYYVLIIDVKKYGKYRFPISKYLAQLLLDPYISEYLFFSIHELDFNCLGPLFTEQLAHITLYASAAKVITSIAALIKSIH